MRRWVPPAERKWTFALRALLVASALFWATLLVSVIAWLVRR